jgi:heme-degrading monooxygenase HmoA
MLVVMVRIPIGSTAEGARLEERFRNRAGLVDDQPGFLGFELLKGDSEFISLTRWATHEDLDRWMRSQAHADAHGRAPTPTGGGHPHAAHHRSEPQSAEPEVGPAEAGTSQGASTLIYEVVIPPEKMR